MRHKTLVTAPVYIAIFISSVSFAAEQVTGWVENAYLYPERFLLRAKIDTGAKNTSINASDLKITTRGTKEWAHFTIINGKGETLAVEKPVQRLAKIRRHSGESQERPVIYLDLCLGGVRKTTEVNLIDRSGFNYQLLIGRSFLQDSFVVDPAKMDLLTDRCK